MINETIDKNGWITRSEEVPPMEVTKISIGSFRRRLNTSEKVAMKGSSDLVVQVLSDDLASTSFVDLKSPQIIEGLGYLQSINILTAERVSELLKTGSESER